MKIITNQPRVLVLYGRKFCCNEAVDSRQKRSSPKANTPFDILLSINRPSLALVCRGDGGDRGVPSKALKEFCWIYIYHVIVLWVFYMY